MNQETLRPDNTLLYEPESMYGMAPMTPMTEEARNFQEEIQELLHYHPELVGQMLPDVVIQEALAGKSLLCAYEDYKSGMLRKTNGRLQREVSTLHQNGTGAQRAPVKAVGGEGLRPRAEDAFLRGFNE